jgi:RNA-directed DNA polymerase
VIWEESGERTEVAGQAVSDRQVGGLGSISGDLARMFNSIVQGWINYYGRFYRSELLNFLRRLNLHLVRWATRKYKRLKRRERRAMAWLAQIAHRSPRLFAHWRLGARPDGWAMGAG